VAGPGAHDLFGLRLKVGFPQRQFRTNSRHIGFAVTKTAATIVVLLYESIEWPDIRTVD
jgi:hypothetical protein